MQPKSSSSLWLGVEVASGYEPLARVLSAALEQAQSGKGAERHAQDGRRFLSQPLLEITRWVGPGFPIGQAIKKSRESMHLPSLEHRTKERLGAIVYLAAAILDDERRTYCEVARGT